MRYSYATISLPTLSPGQAVTAVAGAGFRGIEWKVGEAPHAETTNATPFLVGNRCTLEESEEAARNARDLAEAAGLTVVGLAPYVSSGDIGHLRTVLRMAVAGGAPQIRLQGPRLRDGGPSYRALYGSFLAFLAVAVPEAASAGVRLVIEIHHKTIVPSVGLTKPLLSHFDPADLGVIYDVGNMVYEGYEDYRIGLEVLGPYLHHVHLKNARAVQDADGRWNYEWSPLDDGLVDVTAVLNLLHAHGYDGWVSLEDLSVERSPEATIHHNAKVLARLEAPGWKTPPRNSDYAGPATTVSPQPPPAS